MNTKLAKCLNINVFFMGITFAIKIIITKYAQGIHNF